MVKGVALALGLMLLAPAAGPASPRPSKLTRRARTLVLARVARIASEHRSVSCARVHSRRHVTRWVCAWSAARKRGTVHCRGTYRVSLAGRRWRLASNGYSCATRAVTPAVGFGFNDNAVAQGLVSAPADAALESEAGANTVRVTFDWEYAELKPGQYQLGIYDQIYAALRRSGLRPLFVLLDAPRWAWPAGTLCLDALSYCHFPPGPQHLADAGRMAALLATRYPDAAGIEIWNEPNLSAFWQPRPNASAFVQLLKACYLAVKRVDPSMPVVNGGLSNLPVSRGSDISLHDFLQGMYTLGAQQSTDAIAFHPYPSLADPTLFLRSFADVRSVRHAFGDDARPLWATELGVSTSNNTLPVSDLAQALDLVFTYRALMAMPDVRMIIIHTLVAYGPSSSPDFGYGVLKPDLAPKAAFCALAKLRASLLSCNA